MTVVKHRVMVPILGMEERDPDCVIHAPDPFDNVLQQHRQIEDWEWYDADSVCTCRWEKREAFPRKAVKGAKPKKQCPICNYLRAMNGACAC